MLDVLLVEDDEDVRECIASSLEDAGHHVVQARDGGRAAVLLESRTFDVAICDVGLPTVDGLTLARRARNIAPGTAVILMSSHGSVADVVSIIRNGAVDYLVKPFAADDLIERVLAPIAERRELRKKFEAARSAWANVTVGVRIVAASARMSGLVDRVKGMASSDSCVLFHGEAGSGRKTLARLLHEESARRDGPYVVIPGETLSDLMIDAEVRGLASVGVRDGWFRRAEAGTLVLDGIDRIPVAAQHTLMRVLAEPMAMARRGSDWQPLGVRIVTTSESDLARAVAKGEFLEPLFFRLSTASAAVPPLRERREDLLPLVAGILSSLAPHWASPPTIEPCAYAALEAYSFPGNVAELAWALKCAFLAADTAPIEASHLPSRVQGAPVLDRESGALPM